jgi:hypothetical protein
LFIVTFALNPSNQLFAELDSSPLIITLNARGVRHRTQGPNAHCCEFTDVASTLEVYHYREEAEKPRRMGLTLWLLRVST